jgi:hypothetical protein
MNSPPQESPGRDHHRPCTEPATLERLNAPDPSTVRIKNNPGDSALHCLQRRMRLDQDAYGSPVQASITLSPGCPDRRTLTAIEHPELKRCEVRGSAHDAAKSVHLADHRSFRNPADRRIARHLPDRLERTCNDAYRRPQPGRSHRSLSAGMPGTHDENVKLLLELIVGNRQYHDPQSRLRM